MGKIYLATKQEVQDVEQSVTTINTQINTADTGIDARVTSLEGNNDKIAQLRTDVDVLDDQINDPVTGLVKAVTDIDNDINEADTGIIARIEDLEQGGTTTIKFRTHSTSGKYEDGEIVQRDNILYKANSVIDGSTTSVPFVVGLGLNTWTPVDQKDPSTPVVFQTSSNGVNGALTAIQPSVDGVYIQSLSTNVGGNSIGFQVDADRGRVSYMTNGVQATLESDDMLRLGDADNIYQKLITGGASSITESGLTTNRVLVSNVNGKVDVSAVTSTELGYLDGVTSNIQGQIDRLGGVTGVFKSDTLSYSAGMACATDSYVILAETSDWRFEVRGNTQFSILRKRTGGNGIYTSGSQTTNSPTQSAAGLSSVFPTSANSSQVRTYNISGTGAANAVLVTRCLKVDDTFFVLDVRIKHT